MLNRDTPEVKNWIRDALADNNLNMYQVEGYSVNNESVTGIFERLNLVKNIKELNQSDINQIIINLIISEKSEWLAKYQLSTELGVPLFLILWHCTDEEFMVCQILFESDEPSCKQLNMFNSCYELAVWLGDFKGITVTKKFIEPGRLSYIDECLRKNGVPWPGNLDSFWCDNNLKQILAIFEFSRTRKTPVMAHDVNRYFRQDIYRWKPLDILRKQINVPLFLILWSTDEDIIKFQEIKDIDYKTNSGLKYESTMIIERTELINFFNELLVKLSMKD